MKWTGAASAAIGCECRPHLAVGAAVSLALLSLGAASTGPTVQRLWILLVLAPLAEEATFRLGLHETLLRRMRSPLLANATVALAFALAHVLAQGHWASFAVAVPALLIGAVYERWRKLRLCVALHAAMNALWLGLGSMSV